MSNSARNEPELAKIVSVDNRHVNAPCGSFGAPKLGNSHETGQNRPKLRVLMIDTQTHPRVRQSWKSLEDPKTVSNSPRDGPKSAKTASVDDRHVSAPLGSTTMEFALGPQNGE